MRDGEGLTKFVEIQVAGARVRRIGAKRIALSIGNSPLVKTALAGEDANWGRVVMAVGKAGEPADRDKLSIWFGEHRVAHEGERDPSYSEDAVSAYMKKSELLLRVDLGIGSGPRHDLDLRPDRRIHRDQRRLSELTLGAPPTSGNSPTPRTVCVSFTVTTCDTAPPGAAMPAG